MKNRTKSNRRKWAERMGLITGLTLLFIVVLLWGLRGVTPAHADPGTLYVDGATGSDTTDCTNPAAPCETIGYALTQAANSDEIHVAEGTYTETLDIGITVTLKGGYAISGTAWLPRIGNTVIDADGADAAVICIYPDANVTVEGFTVQGANHVSNWGGGFNINGATTVVISDTVIRDNSTGGCGGGTFIENTVSAENMNVSLINSTVVGNIADCAAGLMVGGGDPFQVTIENTVFTGNTGSDVLSLDQTFEMVGGQVSSNTVTGYQAIAIGGSGVISGTEIVSNTSRAMDIGPDSVVSAHNLTVRGNTGGGIVNGGVLTITDSIIENNSGSTRAAVGSENFAETNRLVMDGCTIRGNSTPGVVGITTGYAEIHNTEIVDNEPTGGVIGIGEGGTTPTVEMVNVLLADNETQGHAVVGHVTGSAMLMNVTATGNDVADNWILFTNGAMTVANTIVWGNTTDIAMLGGPGTLVVSYSDIEDGWTGTGNIDADPWFVDAANGDYHLQSDSPCVDTGTPAGAPAADIEGTPRDAAPDMGAYEWTGFRIFLPLTLRNFGS